MSTGRFNYNFNATVKRSVYAGGKSNYVATGNVYLGFFSPVDQDQNIPGLQTMSQAYQFQTDGDADIQAADRLTIDAVDYIVRGVRKFDLKRQYFIDCQLELAVKN